MGRVVLSAVGGDTGLAGRVSAGLAERGLDVSFLDANYNAGLGNSSTVARPSASGRKPSSIEGCSHMVLLCCPAYVRLLFHPGNSTLRRQVKAAVDAGCSLVPVVSKAWRGISPFTPSHEVAIDDKGFLMFHEHEASALFKAHPVYHYVDSGEGFQLLLSELAAACGCPAHGHNAAALSTLLGAAGLGGGAVRGRLEGMGVRSVADLRALHAAHVHAVHGPPGVGLTEAEATELRLALTGWAHTSTLPRWLRNVEPPLHNALLFVLAASAPSTEQPGLCPTSTSFSRRPSSINAAPSYLAPAPPTAGPPTGWPSLELSPSLGTRGKLGRAGAAAVAALLAELEAVQQAIGGGRSAGAAAAQKLLGALSLRGCGLDAASAGLVLGAPVRLAGLTEINLSGNVVIGADVQDARALGAAAARACSGGGGALTRLRLAHTGLSDEGGAALLSGLAECGGAAAGTVGGRWCGISHLDIGGNALGPASATALARLMRCAPRLSALGLSGTRLASEPVGAASLVAALWGHSSGPAPAPLAQLELSGCAAGGTAGDKGAGALAHAMLLIAANSNTNGKSSDRSGNSPGNSSSGPQWVSFAGSGVARGPGCAAALADAISLGLLLEVKGLSLAWAGPATQQATEGLLRALSATGSGLAHSLLALDLSGCQLGSGACAEMLSIVVLPSLPTLKSLRVEECGLGVRELAQLLAAVALPGALLDLLQAAADAALSAWTADAPEQPWPSTHPAPSTPSTPSTSTLLAPFARASVVALIERFVLGGWRAMREAARRLQAAADSGMDGDCVDGVDGVNGGGVNGGGVNSGLVGSPRSPAAHGRRSSSFTSVGIAAVTPREGGLSVTVGNSPSAGGYSPSGGGYSPSVGGYGGHNRQRPSTASLGGASVATTALGSMRVSEFRSGPAPPLTLQLAQAPGYASGQAGALSGGGKGVILKGVYAQMHIQGARAAASTNSALFSATNARFHRPTTGNVMHTKPIAHLNGGRQRPQSARPCGGVDSGNGCGVDGGVESVDPAHPALELLLCHPAVGRALVECRRAVTHAARNGGASADGCVNDVDDAGGGAASLRRALSRALGPLRASSSCRITSLSAGRNTLSLGASPAAPTAAAAGAVAAAGTAGPSSWGWGTVPPPALLAEDSHATTQQGLHGYDESDDSPPQTTRLSSPERAARGQRERYAAASSNSDQRSSWTDSWEGGPGSPPHPGTASSSGGALHPYAPQGPTMASAAAAAASAAAALSSWPHDPSVPAPNNLLWLPCGAASLGAALGLAAAGTLSQLALPGCSVDSRALALIGAKVSDARSLCDALWGRGLVTELLDLYDCGLGGRHAQGLGLLLRGYSSSLRQLSLDFNLLNEVGVRTQLGPALACCTQLSAMSACQACSEPGTVAALAESLGSCRRLKTLRLYGCPVDAGAGRALGALFAGHPTLASVILGGHAGCALGDNGARVLAQGLAESSSLTSVELPGANLGDYAAKELAKTLDANTRLTQLDLSSNDIGTTGGRSLLEALTTRAAIPATARADAPGGPDAGRAPAEARGHAALSGGGLAVDVIGNALPASLACEIARRSAFWDRTARAHATWPDAPTTRQSQQLRSSSNNHLQLSPEPDAAKESDEALLPSSHAWWAGSPGAPGGPGPGAGPGNLALLIAAGCEAVPALRPPVRMPQARHVVPPKEVSDSHGAPDKTQDEVLELGRQLIAVASTKPAGGATAADDAEIMVAKCRALLETGADIDARDRNGVTEWTVLMHAANCGHTLLVAMLLERGVDVGLTGDDGWNVLMVAAMAGAADVAKLLVAHPGKPAVNARVAYGDGDETCALQLAAASGSADCVTVLLKAGADANAEMASGMTAPLVAASRGHWEVITALLAHRSLRRDTLNAVAPISDELYYGDEVCPLYCAVDQDAADTTQALLDKGADFSMISENQLSGLLSRVIERGDWAAIVRLLGSHAGGSGRMAEALNERVACRELEPACSGVVPMVFVPARAGQHEATALMISRGADATALDEGGVGVLSIAVELDDVAMIRTLLTLTASNPAQQASLLEARAPRSELRSASVTPLGLATLLGCEDCAKVLLEFGAPESDADEVATILRQIQEEQNAVRALGLGRSSRRGSIANYVFESVGTRTSGGAGGDPEFTGAAARAVAAADAGAGGGVDYGVGGVDATAGAARSTDADVADGGVDGVDGADHGVDDVDHGVDRVVDGFEGDGGGADESAGNGEPGGAPEQEQHQEEGGGDGETAGTEQVAAECSNE